MEALFRDLLAWVAAHPFLAYLTVFAVAFAESLAVVGLVVPGVMMLLGAGALIAAGALRFLPVCAWAIAGAIAGDGLSYWLGRRFQDRLRTVWPFTRHPESLEAGVRFFERYGGKSIAFGRFVGPVRAVIPLVAGMMGMSPSRFLLANIVSAIVWAPAYLFPGIVLGASLELAAEAAVRLVLALLTLVALTWLVAWVVQQLFLLFSPRASAWVEGLLRWANLHPWAGETARALADPTHPDARALATLAAALILATALFALATGIAIAGAPDLTVNKTVLDFALSLGSPWGDSLAAALSRLGDLAVILPTVTAIYLWLRLRGHRRQAGYWVAAAAFALLAEPLLKVMLQVPRPEAGLSGLLPWAFPSGHVLRATVIYGFLAVSLAAGMTPVWRWLPYAGAAATVTAVALARLYFGLHWLTDMIGSLALGTAWVAALGLALRRHTTATGDWRGLGLVALAASLTAFATQTLLQQRADVARYRPAPATIALSESEWRSGAWRDLPQHRENLRQRSREPMNIQYAGILADLENELAPEGWAPANGLAWGNWMKLLSPSLPLQSLPVVPQVHAGHQQALALVKPLPHDGRLVLRLWATAYRIGAARTPLWVGNVTAQRKRVILDWLTIPVTAGETAEPFSQFMQDARGLSPERPDTGPALITLPRSVPPAGQQGVGNREMVEDPGDHEVDDIPYLRRIQVETGVRRHNHGPRPGEPQHVFQMDDGEWGLPDNQDQLASLLQGYIRRTVDQVLAHAPGDGRKGSGGARTDDHRVRGIAAAGHRRGPLLAAEHAKLPGSGLIQVVEEALRLGRLGRHLDPRLHLEHDLPRLGDQQVHPDIGTDEALQEPQAVPGARGPRDRKGDGLGPALAVIGHGTWAYANPGH
jgi:membrane protein DedA with SNARE-associated domain/membrane-associated phospholipid phosphatase